MSLHRRNPRRDVNEKPIVAALRKCGVEVHRISGPNQPDLLCWYAGRWTPFGVKQPKGAKTKSEKAGVRWPLIHSFDEAAQAIGLETR